MGRIGVMVASRFRCNGHVGNGQIFVIRHEAVKTSVAFVLMLVDSCWTCPFSGDWSCFKSLETLLSKGVITFQLR